MKRILLIILALSLLLLGACSTAATPLTTASPIDRLEQIDTYKRGIPPRETLMPQRVTEDTGSSMFRGVAFGASMDDVLAVETLQVTETYTNAIDYEYTQMFSLTMHPAYWFNTLGQMYRGGYYMKSDTLEQPLGDIYTALEDTYGSALDYNFYSFDGDIMTFSTFEEGAPAARSGEAYYYMWFSDGEGTDIEAYAERAAESTDDHVIYDIYVLYTDYQYSQE